MIYFEKDRVTLIGKLIFNTKKEADKYFDDMRKFIAEISPKYGIKNNGRPRELSGDIR